MLTAVGEAVTATRYMHRDGITTLADDFIPKPIDLDKLMEIVKDYSEQKWTIILTQFLLLGEEKKFFVFVIDLICLSV